MRVEVLVVRDCPNAAAACEAVRQAARMVGLAELDVTIRVIDTEEQAQRHRFAGSPTFLIDGVDPFATPGAPSGLACRLYVTPAGLSGTPEVRLLADALAGAGSGRTSSPILDSRCAEQCGGHPDR